MGGGDAPRRVEVECPLTDEQLVSCARTVVARLVSGGSGMVRMVEREDLEAMAREAVVRADRSYRLCKATRKTWAIDKGAFLVMDMMRVEARHTVCLSTNEFRGVIRNDDGSCIEPRGRVSFGGPVRGVNNRESQPLLYLRATAPPPWLSIHNLHLRERLECALDELEDYCAAAMFRLSFWHEWTQEDISGLFGISPSGVSKIYIKTCKQLRASFADLSPEERAA